MSAPTAPDQEKRPSRFAGVAWMAVISSLLAFVAVSAVVADIWFDYDHGQLPLAAGLASIACAVLNHTDRSTT